MFTDLRGFIDALQKNPQVVGIVRYGRRTIDDMLPGGDFDLFVFVRVRPQAVESLHFDVQGIPVDMNIRTLDDINRKTPLLPFDLALTTGDILYDPQGELAALIEQCKQNWQPDTSALGEHSRAFLCFSHRHALDKVRHRLTSDPIFSQLLLSSNVYWLLQNYFLIRQMAFPGERAALNWLKSNDTEVHQGITKFFTTNDLAQKLTISESLSERVFAPIDGLWREGKVLAFGFDDSVEDLQAKGQAVFDQLLNVDD
ncbi:MAG: hypothetical protein H6670_01625 [Anaerolineaceae bacterium]|nr:hypothetical protein [Anaerolineaceae bacterium]